MVATSSSGRKPSAVAAASHNTGEATAALIYTALAWREGWWQPPARVHYTLATVALVIFIWQLSYWHLLGVRLAN